jgi:peptidylprolyl isomerase
MPEKRMVQKGDHVAVHYNLKLEDGTVLQSSQANEPINFAAGSAEVLQPVSEAVIGMSPGEKKEVTVPPERAFGLRDESLTAEVSRSKIPQDTKEGDSLKDTASQQTWMVRELKPEIAVLDGNHPLAGQTVVFELELASVT